MDINVKLTLSDRLFELLETKLPNLNRRFQKVIDKEVGKQTREESSISISVSPTPAPPEPGAPETVENPEAEAPAPAAPVETAPEAEAITSERARKHLAETRRRLLGENYEAQKWTVPYKAITALAKQIILMVSGNRVQTIPSLTDEERKRFMDECDALIIGENGMPSFPPAPF